jgi:2-methylfumaryl-CoA hydratase
MSSKGWLGNFFEDFQMDSAWTCPVPRTLTDGDRSTYLTFTGDRTPMFCGPEGFIHPLITFHTVLGQTVRQISLNARANLGYGGMRWGIPVLSGDTLTTSVRIVGLKENSSRQSGIAWVATRAENQKGDMVLEYTRWVMVNKDTAEPTPYLEGPVVPTLPTVVSPDTFMLPSTPRPSRNLTGGPYLFEDYRVGERVFHHDGNTVNASDHMGFTRLFQNSAKVHFDHLLTDNRPLVYGGIPISYGYAQAYNGFENRMGICAMNGGVHANPVYSGDTLYTYTEVIDVDNISTESPIGALRLRMVCLKNRNPAKSEEELDPQQEDPSRPGKKRYHKDVVLDLDYWELMPKSTDRP